MEESVLKSMSPRRKKARRAAACNNNVAKRLASKFASRHQIFSWFRVPACINLLSYMHTHTTAEDKVSIRFIEDGTVHSLPWSKLLTLEEVP